MKEIAILLLKAQSEEEVEAIVDQEYFNSGTWVPLGRHDGNYAVVENQQAHPVAALVEKVTNAQDAILLKECQLRNINVTSNDAPSSMLDAINLFFGNEEERTKKRRQLAEKIIIRADGSMKNPNILIIDQGEGQRPEDFEDTFLSLLKSKSDKKNIRFVQGRYYMGGSGVLPFCGRKGYELIISRSIQGGKWGWTIVRKNRTEERYEYFKHISGIPSFEFEGALDGKEDGTIIKLFNYKLRRPSTITHSLRDDMDLYMFDSYLPVLLKETRNVKSVTTEITLYGNRRKIENSKDLLEPGMPIEVESDFGKFGRRKIEIYVFKSDSELIKQYGEKARTIIEKKRSFNANDMSVFLTINGQTHGHLDKSFIKRCKKPQLEKDLLVHVEFSGISGADRTDTFMPSRDRMKNSEERKQIEDTIEDSLKEDETLSLINEDRRSKLIENSRADEAHVNKVVSKLIKSNPALQKFLKNCGKIINPSIFAVKRDGGEASIISEPEKMPKQQPENQQPKEKKPEPPELEMPFIPSNFNIKGWEGEGIYLLEMPINRKASVNFELNAPSDYFTRKESSGTLGVEPTNMLVMRKLYRGTLTLRFKHREGAVLGEVHTVTVTVTRNNAESLIQIFNIKYTDPIPAKPAIGKKSDEDSDNIEDLGIPTPREVYKDGWGGHGWTENDIVKIEETNGKGNGLDIYINMDSDDLKGYIERNKITTEERLTSIKTAYKMGILLFSYLPFIELKEISEKNNGNGSEKMSDVEGYVSSYMKGVSKIMLDLWFSDEMLK